MASNRIKQGQIMSNRVKQSLITYSSSFIPYPSFLIPYLLFYTPYPLGLTPTLNWVKHGQMASNGIKQDQTGSNEVKQGHAGLNDPLSLILYPVSLFKWLRVIKVIRKVNMRRDSE